METTKLRSIAEIAFPGLTVGLVAGVSAGGLAMIVGQPLGWAIATVLCLGVPLGLLGGGYGLLVAFGKVRIGAFAPAALYWLIGFPLARLIHEVGVWLVLTGSPATPPDVAGFLAYQAIISAGFAIGFLWLHERIAPRWWYQVAPHNPRAAEVFAKYAAHAHQLAEARQRRKGPRRPAKTAEKQG
ncbi:hypothetical protein [Amycolatopsis nigrescens]|uniref:hypothetical protein n=1 Tax=Amycolatopsis nigrescens TaxID=381445 RepID=UPI000374401F|nr:hypothetical protein [Amycolatopsis nigrescens]